MLQILCVSVSIFSKKFFLKLHSLLPISTLVASYFAIMGSLRSMNSAVSVKELTIQPLERQLNNTIYNTTDYSFLLYTKRLVNVSAARMSLQAIIIQSYIDFVVAVLTCVAYFCNVFSLIKWKHFSISSKGIILGWLITYMSPMISSVFPTRAFLDR